MISGPKSSFSVRTASNQSSSSLLLLLPLLTDNWNMRALLRKTRFTGLSGLSVSVNSGSFFLPPSSYRLFVWRLDRSLHLGTASPNKRRCWWFEVNVLRFVLACAEFLPPQRDCVSSEGSGSSDTERLPPAHTPAACLSARPRERETGRQAESHPHFPKLSCCLRFQSGVLTPQNHQRWQQNVLFFKKHNTHINKKNTTVSQNPSVLTCLPGVEQRKLRKNNGLWWISTTSRASH